MSTERLDHVFSSVGNVTRTKIGPEDNEIQPGGTVFFTGFFQEATKADLIAVNKGEKLLYIGIILRYGDTGGTLETEYCSYYRGNATIAHLCQGHNVAGQDLRVTHRP